MDTPPTSPIPENARKAFSGVIFDVYQWEQPQFDGTTKTFERLRRPDTAILIPVTEEGTIILAEQEQPGRQPFVGLPGGRVEAGEDPMEAARRELLEETGYQADSLQLIDRRRPASKIDWSVYTYVAHGCRKAGEQRLDAGERIALRPVGFDELLSLSLDHEILPPSLMRHVIEAQYDPAKEEALRRLLYDPA